MNPSPKSKQKLQEEREMGINTSHACTKERDGSVHGLCAAWVLDLVVDPCGRGDRNAEEDECNKTKEVCCVSCTADVVKLDPFDWLPHDAWRVLTFFDAPKSEKWKDAALSKQKQTQGHRERYCVYVPLISALIVQGCVVLPPRVITPPPVSEEEEDDMRTRGKRSRAS